MPRFYGSVVQPKSSKREDQGPTPGSFSLMFIKNLINNKSKQKKKNVTNVFYCPIAPICPSYSSPCGYL